MRKLFVGVLILGILAWSGSAFGAGSCTQDYDRVASTGMRILTLTCTDDASDADTTAWTVTSKRTIQGLVIAADTNPGATAPDDNYDITIKNTDGIDIFGTSLTNRDTTTSERAFPLQNGTYGATPSDGQLTIAMTNNNVESAIVVIKLYWFGQ